ncbi:hypothetical protein [Tepidibacillus marianensis]|uniref:hypothetical protein n=1 Tax=Tepidibacillus marianensis TaxID=3131995 RepID=UPI0030CBFC33
MLQTNLELLFRHPNHTIEEESVSLYKSLQEVKRMDRLVTDLLTLARTDSSQQLLQTDWFFIDEVVKHVVEQFEPLIEMKKIQLKHETQNEISYWGDRERIHQLLVILIDNAMKYTSEKGTIGIYCTKEKIQFISVLKIRELEYRVRIFLLFLIVFIVVIRAEQGVKGEQG